MRNIKYLVILLFMVVSFSYGLFIGIYKVFPYEQVRAIKRFVSRSTSINFPTIKNPRTTLFEYFSPKCEIVMIGDSITLMVISIQGDKVRLGIEAPKEVSIHREEVYQAIQQERSEANRGAEASMS